MSEYEKHHKHVIDIYKTIFLMDGIEEPFREFGPDHPKIGDFVSPDTYYSSNFTYKLSKIYSKNITPEMMNEALAARWVCTRIYYHSYHMDMTFRSLDKIGRKRRSVTYRDHYDLKCEIVDMPEKARLIIEYKNGNISLYDLLTTFKKKNYTSSISFNSIFLTMNGDDYLEVIDSIEANGGHVPELGPQYKEESEL